MSSSFVNHVSTSCDKENAQLSDHHADGDEEDIDDDEDEVRRSGTILSAGGGVMGV